MILIVAFAVVALSVPLLGGRLSLLASLELRGTWLLYAALAIQLLILEVLPSTFGAGEILHLASYGLAIAFLATNRRMPGMALIAIGAAANLAAITANGGVMPASASAVATAGLSTTGEHFANSAAVTHPRLLLLGDIFAVPEGLPLANVFSIGDICLLVGGAVALHATCGSRLGRLVNHRAIRASTTASLAFDAGGTT